MFTFEPNGYFGSNCHLISVGDEYAVVDPSVDYTTVYTKHPEISGRLKYILLTHCHFDHILHISSWVSNNPDAEVIIGAEDGPGLSQPMVNCYLGFLGVYDGYDGKYTPVGENSRLTLGDKRIRVIDSPGHTAGGVSYRIDDCLFVGDTLFEGGGYGRCDLPGGDFSLLEKTIIKIITREAEAKVYTGHGLNTTLSEIIKNLM